MKKPFLCRIWLHDWYYAGRVWFRKRIMYKCARCGSIRIVDGNTYYKRDN